MNEAEALAKMVPPGQKRPSCNWRGGVIQIHITRACDLACFACTQGSNLKGKPVKISLEGFETACRSLTGYEGVVGMFGGNPATHPQFEELCGIFSAYFPKEQRGLWCNNPLGKGKIMRETFNPRYSNLNVHCSKEAHDEFKRDWPESNPIGLNDVQHSTWAVAMRDEKELTFPDGSRRENTEENRWELITTCDVNQHWSAMICELPGKGVRGFFCEIAGAQAILHAHDPSWPDLGMKLDHWATLAKDYQPPSSYRQWWEMPMSEFADQARFYCHRCGVPSRRKGQLAIGGDTEEVSYTHADIYNPKVSGRPVQLVTIDLPGYKGQVQRVTDYIGNAH